MDTTKIDRECLLTDGTPFVASVFCNDLTAFVDDRGHAEVVPNQALAEGYLPLHELFLLRTGRARYRVHPQREGAGPPSRPDPAASLG